MVRYIVVRIARSIVLLLALTLVIFFVTRMLGDPAARQLPLDATPEQIEQRRESLGLNRPFGEQLGDYLGGVFTLDFGESTALGADSLELVRSRVPNTLLLVVTGLGLAALIGVPLGVAIALSKRRWVEYVGNTFSIVALSTPQFWVGILLILLFAVWLGWLPSSGIGSWRNLVLPAVTLSLAAAGRVAQITATTLREEMAKPYVRTARVKGLSSRRVLWHALRNVGVPVLTIFGFEFITALAGYTILVETVFAWPGLGLLLVEAVRKLDLSLTAATGLMIAAWVIVANAVIDIAYRVMDPRIDAEAAR